MKIDIFFAHIVLKKDAISRIRQNEVLFYDIKELKSIGIDIPEKAVHLTREQFCQFHSEGLLFCVIRMHLSAYGDRRRNAL